MEERTLYIPAISCMHCIITIKRELESIEGVDTVSGNHTTKEVTVSWKSPATWDEIVSTLDDIGYPPAE